MNKKTQGSSRMSIMEGYDSDSADGGMATNERDGTMNTCACSYASPLGADYSLSKSRTSNTTSKTQKKEKVVVDTCDSLSSIDLNLCGVAPINIPSKLDAKIFKKQTSSSPIVKCFISQNYMSTQTTYYWVDKTYASPTKDRGIKRYFSEVEVIHSSWITSSFGAVNYGILGVVPLIEVVDVFGFVSLGRSLFIS
ncbi:hypothetical protein Tco_1031988 [Tanacetum coccineum]|uniref:BRCT domain-containing protein n=1 Tax=Tanacetum coccineum TaxID=301880 RepID=A0ABQ5GCL7_9ASTR